MIQLKDIAIETIRRLPDNCSLEDILYEIVFVAGRVLTTEELFKRIDEWAK